MTSLSAFRAAAALGAASALLGGCITIFPETPPAQLYRFGYADTPSAPAGADPARARVLTPVLLDTVGVSRAAGGDTILTVAGNQAAYVAGARWDAPASLLFTEAVIRAFDERSGRVRLVARGGIGRTAATLRLYVRDLEADYGDVTLPAPVAKSGGKAAPPPNLPAPTAVVAVHARLLDGAGAVIDERDFVARKPAADNRVGAIVPAVNAAIGEVLTNLVAWTDGAAPPPTAPTTLAPPRAPTR